MVAPGSLLWKLVFMMPLMMVNTLTPKGANSNRKASDCSVSAAFEALYVAGPGG